MCGIAGIWKFGGGRVESSTLEHMAGTMDHRGPDAGGYHLDSKAGIGLAHRRLSIIDLTRQADQPMSDARGKLWIVFNGEIYNYVELREELGGRGEAFKTQSDTEVILAAYRVWELDFLSKLRGMFAFALFDSDTDRLILARDRVGKKPLYYAQKPGSILFASTPSAILASGLVDREPDFEGLESCLILGFVPPPRTGFKDIQKLPPGHYMVVERSGKPRIRPYWQLDFGRKEKRSREEWEDIVRQQISESVRIRLRSDVPLGVFLSGGIDSSAVAAFARPQVKTLQTFTIGFQQPEWDERRYARMVAERLETDHHEIVVDPKPSEILPMIIRHYDDPMIDASAIPSLYVSEAARKHVKVVLNGDGGDEVFAGYRGYQAFRAAQWARRVPGSGLIGRLAPWLPEAPRGSMISRLKRLLELAHDSGHVTLNRYAVHCFHPTDLHAVLGPAWRADGLKLAEQILEDTAQSACHLKGVDALLMTDFRLGLPGRLLVKMDRASMAHSLEARSPLLDHILIETVAGMPAALKLHGLTTKYILKRALRDFLPHEILHRGKMGFGVPLGDWFRGELREPLETQLGRGRLVSSGFLNGHSVRSLIGEHGSGKRDHGPRLWTLYCLELWWRHHFLKESTAGNP